MQREAARAGRQAGLWITSPRQLEAAAGDVDEFVLLDDELELELSDLVESDFLSVEPDELEESDELEAADSVLFAEPFAALLAASRLSLR
jgi:hypothetical protein